VKERKLLFSVTAKDCRWDYFKGTGAGGQKKLKEPGLNVGTVITVVLLLRGIR